MDAGHRSEFAVRCRKNRVVVEIGGIDETTWKATKEKFLFLNERTGDDQVVTRTGTLLLAPRFKGKIFVKGIFVANDPKLAYGYELPRLEVDRDRKMVDRYHVQHWTQHTWANALATRPDLVGAFSKLLLTQSHDIHNIDEGNASNIPKSAQQAVLSDFRAKYGPTAVPVATLAESKDLAHLGKKGIVVAGPLKAVLEQQLGNVATTIEDLKQEAVKAFSWDDLSAKEQKNLEDVIALVNPIEPVTLDNIKIANFRDASLEGTFDSKADIATIAHKMLKDRNATLGVLIHELAHRNGRDGDHEHISRLERIWQGVAAVLWTKS